MKNHKKLKFLIIGPKKRGLLSKDLLDAIGIRGHLGFFLNSCDFIFEINAGNLRVYTKRLKNLFDFDVYLFRSFSKTMANSRIFVEELKRRDKIIIEECISNTYINSKLAEGARLIRNDLNYPKTYQMSNNKAVLALPKNFFPVIVKPTDGARGRNINLIKNKHALSDFLQKNTEDFLIQEYLQIQWDARVFVVGKKVLGGIKRYVLNGDCRSNASLGSRVEVFKITPEIKKIALLATKSVKYIVAGVDLAWVENKQKWYVLEVNISPQWHAFKRVTGINPASAIIDYAIKRVIRNK